MHKSGFNTQRNLMQCCHNVAINLQNNFKDLHFQKSLNQSHISSIRPWNTKSRETKFKRGRERKLLFSRSVKVKWKEILSFKMPTKTCLEFPFPKVTGRKFWEICDSRGGWYGCSAPPIARVLKVLLIFVAPRFCCYSRGWAGWVGALPQLPISYFLRTVRELPPPPTDESFNFSSSHHCRRWNQTENGTKKNPV